MSDGKARQKESHRRVRGLSARSSPTDCLFIHSELGNGRSGRARTRKTYLSRDRPQAFSLPISNPIATPFIRIRVKRLRPCLRVRSGRHCVLLDYGHVGVFVNECSLLICCGVLLVMIVVMLPGGRRGVVCLLLCRQVKSNVVCCQTTAIVKTETQDSLGLDVRQHSITLGL